MVIELSGRHDALGIIRAAESGRVKALTDLPKKLAPVHVGDVFVWQKATVGGVRSRYCIDPYCWSGTIQSTGAMITVAE